jgi:hypothetical protein
VVSGQLAFIGAFQGPTADLYLYNLEDQEITQLTDGPSQGYGPAWSPDGEWILNFGASNFGTGAGFDMTGVWAVRADSSGVDRLYTPDELSGGEELIGWMAPDTFVVSRSGVCPGSNLRSVNLSTGEVNTLFEGCFWGAAIAEDGTLGVVVDDDLATMSEGTAGLFLLPPGGADPLHIPEAGGDGIHYAPELDSFLVSKYDWPEVMSFTPDGGQGLYRGWEPDPGISPDGEYWAEGLFPVAAPVWMVP